MNQKITFAFWLLIFLNLLCLPSCTSHKKKAVLNPTKGSAFYRKNPMSGATVLFIPKGNNTPEALKPEAEVAEDGSFELSTGQIGKGAPEGEYDVIFIWQREDPKTRTTPSLLPQMYSQVGSSGIQATIRPGANELQPFELN